MAKKRRLYRNGTLCGCDSYKQPYPAHQYLHHRSRFEQRVRRMMEVNNLPLKEAVRRLKKIDKGHEQYYHFLHRT